MSGNSVTTKSLNAGGVIKVTAKEACTVVVKVNGLDVTLEFDSNEKKSQPTLKTPQLNGPINSWEYLEPPIGTVLTRSGHFPHEKSLVAVRTHRGWDVPDSGYAPRKWNEMYYKWTVLYLGGQDD